MSHRALLLLAPLVVGCFCAILRAADPLAPWEAGAKISAVAPGEFHSIHSYFNTCPESPDGTRVLFYASTAEDGQKGDIRVLERATGKVTVIASDIATEDAHRVACQQWVSGGSRVAFHRLLPDKTWAVCVVDADGKNERVLAKGRQLGYGQPAHSIVPMYGPHWDPKEHTGLELCNVETGEITKTPLTPEAVRAKYPEFVAKRFGDKPTSIFFPVLSPDLGRVFFKLATPAGGDFQSTKASERFGLICYELKQSEFRFMNLRWGHPAWSSDSRHILEVHGVVYDSDDGSARQIPGYPHMPGTHPSFSPDRKLFTSDTQAKEEFAGPPGQWAVVVGDAENGKYVVVHRFQNDGGAKSWRISHPHPVFSPDGKRLYFNVSEGKWTTLHVAEVK